MNHHRSSKHSNKSDELHGGRPVAVPFHYLLQATAASNVFAFPIQPNMCSHLQDVGNTYALYRFKKLQFRLLPSGSTRVGDQQAVGYIPGVVDTAPNTYSQVMEIIPSVALKGVQTVPTEWVRLNRNDLGTYQPWLKTVPGSPATDVEIQGNIFGYCALPTGTFDLELRGVCEFKDPLQDNQTPESRARVMEKEKERLLRILSFSAGSKTPGDGKVLAAALPK
jgi:hypothetical protein